MKAPGEDFPKSLNSIGRAPKAWVEAFGKASTLSWGFPIEFSESWGFWESLNWGFRFENESLNSIGRASDDDFGKMNMY